LLITKSAFALLSPFQLSYSARMTNWEILHNALECFADPTRRAHYFDLYSDDIVLHGYAGVDPGIESVKRYYQAFWSAFPDARVTVEDKVEQGDKMALRFLITGTHQGPILNVAPAGTPVSFAGMTILQFNSGKCVERWSITDSISLLVQLGVDPTPH
jgi:predicted ester cyclase